VHRDLKPSNVLLAADGPRLIDFGIARAADATAITQTGVVVGTPPFMSPEQALGEEIDPPSDVFSLASVLVFAMTGSGPFGTVSSPLAMLRRISDEEPDLGAVPGRFRPLLEACFAKEPAARPTAAELARRLAADAPETDSWQPTLGMSSPFIEELPAADADRSARVNRRLALIGTGAGLALIALTAAGASLLRRETPGPPPEVAPPVPPTASVRWTAQGSERVDALVAAEGRVFIGTGRGVRAIDTATHADSWGYDVTSPVDNPLGDDPSTLSAGGGLLFYSVLDTVHAFDAATGRSRWTRGITGGDAYSSLLGVRATWSDGTVYATYARKVFAHDPDTGEIRWEFEVVDEPEATGGRISAGSPQAVGGRCFVTAGAGVEAIDVATGRRLWRYPTGKVNSSELVVAGDVVVVASFLIGVTALDAETGAVRWTVPLTDKGADSRSRPLVVGDLALVRGDRDEQIHALDIATGATRWVWPGAMGGGTDLAPVIDNGVVYAAHSSNDRMFALDAATGTVRWQILLGNDVSGVSSVAARDGTVYLACRGLGNDSEPLLAVAVP
jgi:outer membrane protein assembly factor BamB